MGVLSELAHRSGVEIETTFRPATMNWLYDGDSTALTGPTLEWSGVAYRNGAFDLKEGVRTNLAELNDDYFTFAQLADVIEYFF